MASSSNPAPESEHRKVRKGTKSCWQCKDRKVRCSFSEGRTCDNCLRRGTLCFSQRHPNATSLKSKHPDRIGRVETKIQQLVQSINDSGLLDRSSNFVPSSSHNFQEQQDASFSVEVDSPRQPASPELNNYFGSDAEKSDDNQTMVSTLHTAWPSKSNLETILTAAGSVTWCLRGLLSTPSSNTMCEEVPSPRSLLQLPPIGSDAVVIAQRLLLLGVYITAAARFFAQTDLNCSSIVTHAVKMARKLVNSNDDLIRSVQGIESLALESMYYDMAGDLHYAWLAMRRALSTAQMLNLHKSSSQNQRVNEKTKQDNLWLRLVQRDRYLSLMLGLPQGSSDETFANEEVLKVSSPLERLQRLDCLAAGRILRCIEVDIDDYAKAFEIDKVFQRAASSVDPQWWLIPELKSDRTDQTIEFQETNRLMDQLTHFYLMAQLHLPYFLRFSEARCEYSKVTATIACREVLSRFLAFHDMRNSDAYCHGICCVVFMCSTMLCLAHIDATSRNQLQSQHDESFNHPSPLAHQRPVDRGMVERAHENLRQLALESKSCIVSNISMTLDHLLRMEMNAANGNSYRINPIEGWGVQCGSISSDDENKLQIKLPSYGTIEIELINPSSSALSPSSYDWEVPDVCTSNDLISEPMPLTHLNTASNHATKSMFWSDESNLTDPMTFDMNLDFFDDLVRDSSSQSVEV